MMIQFQCVICGKIIESSDDMIGKVLSCPKCNKDNIVQVGQEKMRGKGLTLLGSILLDTMLLGFVAIGITSLARYFNRLLFGEFNPQKAWLQKSGYDIYPYNLIADIVDIAGLLIVVAGILAIAIFLNRNYNKN